MSETEGSGGDFIPIGDPEETEALLHEAFRDHAPAIVWTANQRILIRVSLGCRVEGGEAFTFMLPAEVEPASVAAELSAMEAPECHFSVSLSRATVLFRARLRRVEWIELCFECPRKIFKVQRRKDLRIEVRDGYVLKVEFALPEEPSQRLVRKCHDLSAGGISFLIEPHEAWLFKEGLRLQSLRFSLSARQIQTDGLVRHCRPVRGRAVHKVGVQFTDLKASDAQHISRYVFDENVKRMSRYL